MIQSHAKIWYRALTKNGTWFTFTTYLSYKSISYLYSFAIFDFLLSVNNQDPSIKHPAYLMNLSAVLHSECHYCNSSYHSLLHELVEKRLLDIYLRHCPSLCHEAQIGQCVFSALFTCLIIWPFPIYNPDLPKSVSYMAFSIPEYFHFWIIGIVSSTLNTLSMNHYLC